MISTGLINREEEDRILNLAVLTQEHVLMVGPPGTAKSLEADLFFGRLGGRFFKTSLTKFSTEEALFGPIDLPALKQGEYRFQYRGSILDSHWAFVDEVFDAPDPLLRSLLSVLNEREFRRGSFYVRCPLITCVGTANYTRVNEVTEAVVDRFLFQWFVKPLDREGLDRLFEWRPPDSNGKVPLRKIRAAQARVDSVEFPSHLRGVFLDLCVQFNFSPRRVFKAIRVCKAHAHLNGREAVEAEDLVALKYLVSTDGEKIAEATKVILETTVVAARAYEQMMLIDALVREWEEVRGEHYEVDHLREEAGVIRRLKAINPVSDEVAKRKADLLEEYERHYSRGKAEYLKEVGLS